jgi:hypothetical protein
VSKKSVAARVPEASGRGQEVLGAPPISGTDKKEEYWSFAAAIAHDLDPADSIMMLLVKDVTGCWWSSPDGAQRNPGMPYSSASSRGARTEVRPARLRHFNGAEIGNSRFRLRISKDGHKRGRARGHPSRRAPGGVLLWMRSVGSEFCIRSDQFHRIDPLARLCHRRLFEHSTI